MKAKDSSVESVNMRLKHSRLPKTTYVLRSAEAALQHVPSKPKAGGSVVGTNQSHRRLLSQR